MTPPADPGARAKQRGGNWLLLLLMVIASFNFVDRLALGLMLEDIKVDLQLSDTQLGLLTGIAFALFYAAMGIPIARWADRGNRVSIIAVTTALWSALVALCGLSTSFVQLMLIRIGVAVGEAGCVPPANSLISDSFARGERPRAMAVYMISAPLSAVVGYFIAGWLNELYGWRVTFICLGVPGIFLAAAAALTLKEPRASSGSKLSRGSAKPSARLGTGPGFLEVLRFLLSSRAFRHLLVGFSVSLFFGYGVSQWQPTFFIRSYHLQTGPLGTWLALIYGVCGSLGTYWGGVIASRYASKDETLQLKVMALMFAALGFVSAAIYLAPSQFAAFGLLAVFATGYYSMSGPLLATIQALVPENMRATALAVIYLCGNLVGMGLGPLAVGALSDALSPWLGEDSLRYALLAMTPGYVWIAWHFWRASQSAAEDIDAVQQAVAP